MLLILSCFFFSPCIHTIPFCPPTYFPLTILQTLLPVSAYLYLLFLMTCLSPPRPGSVSRAGSGSDSSLCPPHPAQGWPQSRWQSWFTRGMNGWCDWVLDPSWGHCGGRESMGEGRLEAGKTARNLLVMGRRPHGRSWEDGVDPACNCHFFLPSNGGCDLCRRGPARPDPDRSPECPHFPS